MKTTFKKSIAAISAAAVVAASAAVFAIPADAATATLTCDTVELTLSELQAMNNTVTLNVNISSNPGFSALGMGIKYDDRLTIVDTADTGVLAAVKNTSGVGNNAAEKVVWLGVAVMKNALTGKNVYATGDGAVWYFTFEVPSDAKEGDVYPVQMLASNNGTNQEITYGDANTKDSSTLIDGAIIIKGDTTTTTTTTTTEATTTTTTTKPTTTTTTTTTTEEATTTATSKTGGTTSSPQTSDVLPVAGAAAALVVIGGVALVAKKRK